MKKSLALLAAALVSAPVMAAESFTIDSRHTFPVFEINHLGFSTQRGRFNKTSGKITLDRAAKKGSVELTIDAASIDMGIDKWDEIMRSEEFFDVAKHPTITFKSDTLLFEGDKVVGANGILTMMGIPQPVTMKVSNFTCGTNPVNKKELCAADTSTTIKRSDFGITKYVPAVADEVKILVPVEAFKD